MANSVHTRMERHHHPDRVIFRAARLPHRRGGYVWVLLTNHETHEEDDVPNTDTLKTLRGATVLDEQGDKIGSLDEIYVDDDTGRLEWAAVRTGLFGTGFSFVPLAGAEQDGDELRVPFSKDKVKDAPGIDPDGELTEGEEAELYSYYGMSYGDRSSTSGLPEGAATGGPVGHDVSGPTTDDAMTRSEEELHVGTERRESGRARLRKYVETETQTETVPVRRETARVEREPITDANVDRATSGPEISDEEHEVILTEERPVVEKRTVPKERVRLEKDVVTDEETVSGDVRKERITTEGDAGTADTR
jgi:uncharacterized protein (TIGR02271 family)